MNKAHGLVMKFFWTHVPTVVNPIVYTLANLEESNN
jgi:hypothetical protein